MPVSRPMHEEPEFALGYPSSQMIELALENIYRDIDDTVHALAHVEMALADYPAEPDDRPGLLSIHMHGLGRHLGWLFNLKAQISRGEADPHLLTTLAHREAVFRSEQPSKQQPVWSPSRI